MSDTSDPLLDDARPDGRRQRSARSRRQIVEAMVKIVRGGDMRPSAARVAEVSGVSLRTVFRHFEDMDSLFREMTAIIEAEIRPIFERPLQSKDWRGKIDELIGKRIEIYERILPLRVSGSVRRFQSDFLKHDHEVFLELEQAGLKAVVPKSLQRDHALFSSLCLLLSFEAWRGLRQDQGLTRKDAEAAMRFGVDKLLAGL